MSDKNCIVVGASHAAAQISVALRQNGWDKPILIFGDEQTHPYNRPPLSKDFLSGEQNIDDLLIRPSEYYEKQKIQFELGVRVESIDRSEKKIVLANAREINYEKLVLTTGANVRRLPVPGADLPGVFYLRTLADAKQISGYIGKGKKAVIIGGGYIGLETAASLQSQGMQVTVLEAASRILERVTTEEISAFYTRVHTEEGVTIVTGAMAQHIEGEQNVERVICQEGKSYDADLVIIGVGVTPATKLAEDANLEVDNGIVVDEYARTNDHDILAAGDCTSHFNPIYQRNIRLESVQNATDQAKVAAKTICGDLKPYSALPWFWSDQYDIKLQIAGLSQGFDQVITRGDITRGRSFAAFYMKEGRVLAVDAINKPQEFMSGKRLITRNIQVDPTKLADEAVSMKEVLSG